MNIVSRILSVAKEKHINQTDLAQKLQHLGVTKQTITDWKSNKSNSYYYYIVEIADVLETTTDYLLMGREPVQQNINLNENETKLLSLFSQLLEWEKLKTIYDLEQYIENKNLKEIGNVQAPQNLKTS